MYRILDLMTFLFSGVIIHNTFMSHKLKTTLLCFSWQFRPSVRGVQRDAVGLSDVISAP